MDINATSRNLESDPATNDLVNFLSENEGPLGLTESQVYFEFPILKDLDDVVIISKLLLVSREHGVVVLAPSSVTSHAADVSHQLVQLDTDLDHIFSLLYSRLIRNKTLRKNKTELAFPTGSIIYVPLVGIAETQGLDLDATLALSRQNFEDALASIRVDPVEETLYQELVATVEGAKGLLRPKVRPLASETGAIKGRLANALEAEIASFDQRQKQGAIVVLDGLQRIRGLAGSGKTVVLAMKAALTHLRNPDANILYTFHTRSLYQHIQRLVTRFYRQFDDKDPDWNRLKIMHAWGGRNTPGVYYNASLEASIQPIPFTAAAAASPNPFDFVCRNLLDSGAVQSAYDYVFIDEGQDFPASFIQLCVRMAAENRVVFAYDDLQTIFQATTPALAEIVGMDGVGKPSVELTEDIILYKCYRNPREILVCAHALGFGIYGSRIVQMLENKEQWEDVGYRVVEGTFLEGARTVIERPAENSLTYLSDHQKPQDLVKTFVYSNYREEVASVAESILQDIKEGLRPDDILVAVVDDRYAKTYLKDLDAKLLGSGVQTNNVHADPFGIRDFNQEGAVTLSTVHKAKGNEAFMVYVLGVDALFLPGQTVRERNLLFTAMTRAKGWVRVSGVGDGATACKAEIATALTHFPNLVFNYPGPEELKVLRRDLDASAERKQRSERKLDDIMGEMSVGEIQDYIYKKSGRVRKGK